MIVRRRRLVLACLGAAACLGLPTLSLAAEPADYSVKDNWLCLPDRDDACDIDLSATVVTPSGVGPEGTALIEEWPQNPNAAVDCFYVYPTVSNDPGGNSDLEAGPEELGVVRNQLARFGSQCKIYAPLYQQITLTALVARMSGGSIESDRALAYGDVVNSWNYYLDHYNQGRGVVLIGHSQGAGMLKALIAQNIDGKPIQKRIVSALLLGSNTSVPKGKDVGGDFKHMALCRSASQTQCVVSYVTFRDTVPPPAASLFGRTRAEGMTTACTNPAALAGGAVSVDPYLSAAGVRAQTVTWAKGLDVATPFVTTPGLLAAECVERDGASYLEVHINADPEDARTDEIAGDVVIGGQVNAGWGLHLIDVDVVMGDLVAMVGKQAAAYISRQ